ncbi:1416_t:CDS:2 [Ambispora gerdemannii]|uniref:1416_t:CDS:1 n=1 Tax=Ambispora gerdemannii TaxID=144530 RepID=A0A9N9A1G5_9GLOM|nr:1416_t:CDS:2 [Ambispora gerdemannii]
MRRFTQVRNSVSTKTTFPTTTLLEKNEHITEKLLSLIKYESGRLLLMTGAGVSTDSGIPDYRGPKGTYTVNKNYKPTYYQEFAAHHHIRQRYWARSYFGWPRMQRVKPNSTHFAFAKLQSLGHIQEIITQNVDALHQAAGSHDILELHGTLHQVHCMQCGHINSRIDHQKILSELNPAWAEFLELVEHTKERPRLNPDGDVELPSNVSYETFKYPPCEKCHQGIYKPSLVFFGGNISENVKERSNDMILRNDSVLIVGSTLTTYFAFKLVKLAKELGKNVGIINLGPTKGDDLADYKIEAHCGKVIPAIADYLSMGR